MNNNNTGSTATFLLDIREASRLFGIYNIVCTDMYRCGRTVETFIYDDARTRKKSMDLYYTRGCTRLFKLEIESLCNGRYTYMYYMQRRRANNRRMTQSIKW